MAFSDGSNEEHPGVISVHEVYTLDEFKLRMRMSDSALSSARRAGLRVLQSGKRRYINGADALEFLQKRSTDKPT